MNPLTEQMAPTNNLKNAMAMIKSARNPYAAMEAMAQSNPQIRRVIDMCRGRDPKDVFMEKCRQMGYDPDEIINMLK